jgi:hypothetical protein
MQAADIIPGEIYAANVRNIVCRLTVTAVNTTQSRTPLSKRALSTSIIEGEVNPNDLPPDTPGDQPLHVKLAPDAVLDRYDKYEELKQKQAQEEAANEAKNKRLTEEARKLRAIFYRLTAIPMPDKPEGFGQPFRASHGGQIEIYPEGVSALLRTLSHQPLK